MKPCTFYFSGDFGLAGWGWTAEAAIANAGLNWQDATRRGRLVLLPRTRPEEITEPMDFLPESAIQIWGAHTAHAVTRHRQMIQTQRARIHADMAPFFGEEPE